MCPNRQRLMGMMMRRQIDPVCGMEVEENAKVMNYLHQDKTYYFCALSCKNQFERSPEEYLENPAVPDKNHNSRAIPVNFTESANLDKLLALLKENENNLADFFENDEKGYCQHDIGQGIELNRKTSEAFVPERDMNDHKRDQGIEQIPEGYAQKKLTTTEFRYW